MFKLITGTAETYTEAGGATKLAVPFQIVDETGTVVYEAKHSFELTATADEIKEAMARALAVYQEDAARHEEAKGHQADLDAAAATSKEISNLTI